MAAAKRPGKAPPTRPEAPRPETPRHPGVLRPVGAVLPAVTRAAFRKEGALLGTLLADWPAVIGPVLAAAAIPRRLSAGTLVLGCAGPVALELQHMAGPLIERVNTHLGRPAVQRLRFVQEAPRPPPPAPPAPKRPAAAASVPVDGIADGPLRDALRALGAALKGAAPPEPA